MANEFKVRKGLIVYGSGSSPVLDVQGSQGQLFSITDSLSGSLWSVNDISGIPVMEAFSDNTIKIGTFGNEAIIVSGSSTGMGTATPTAKLHISGSSGSALFEIDSPAQNNIIFVSGSGNVGIGTTGSATYKFDVSGSSRSTDGYYVGNNSVGYGLGSTQNGTYIVALAHSNGIYGLIRNVYYSMIGFQNNADIRLHNAEEVRYQSRLNSLQTAVVFYDNTTKNYNWFRNNIGIGGSDTAPSASLHVSGSSNSGLFRIDSPALNNIIFVSGSGNVGLGNFNPQYRLDVSGSGNFTDKLILSSSIEMQLGSGRSGIIERSGNAIQIRNSATGTHVRYNDTNRTDHFQINYFSNGVDITPGGNSTTFGLVITSGSYPAATLLRAGVNTLVVTGSNVGIGTLTPDSGSLHISASSSGTGATERAIIVKNTSGVIFDVRNNGNVGIGGEASTSTYKLRVHGSLWADSLEQLQTLNGTAGVGKIEFYNTGGSQRTIGLRTFGFHASEGVKGFVELSTQGLTYTGIGGNVLHADSDFLDVATLVLRSNNTSGDSFYFQNYHYGSGSIFVTKQPAGGDTSFRFRPGRTTEMLTISQTGIGINKTTPSSTLDVSGSVLVTGSLTVSGSSTLTNIGPAIFSGSLAVTAGITGSLLGTASYVTTAESASYSQYSEYILNDNSVINALIFG